jgi:hypothetical protein
MLIFCGSSFPPREKTSAEKICTGAAAKQLVDADGSRGCELAGGPNKIPS